MILTTWMILHPRMALIGHHTQVEIKFLTQTHPLKQRIEIDTDVDPIVVIRLNPIIIVFTMGGVLMTVAIVAPLTHPARRMTEVGEVRGIKAEMTIGHPDATHAPCKCIGVQERGQCPLIRLHIMSGTMKTTLMIFSFSSANESNSIAYILLRKLRRVTMM